MLELAEQAAPDTPPSGYCRVYVTTTGNLAAKDDAGAVHSYGYEFSINMMASGYLVPGTRLAPVQMPYAGEIQSVRVSCNSACTLQADVWKGVYSSLPLASNLTIVASAPPSLSSAYKNEDTTLTGWTVAFAKGDWVQAVLTSISNGSPVTISLAGKRT